MSGSYRGIVIAIAGLASLSGGMWFGLDQQALYQQEADQRHADYSRRAADQIKRTCAATAVSQKPNCIKEAVNEYRLKYRDNRREYDDLVAQRTSALWTGIMGVAALIGMFLSAVGVALVYTTFAEAKKTNRIAMREGARSTRRAISAADDTAKALVIAQNNACALIEANETARDARDRQLRAYISIESLVVENVSAGRVPSGIVNIINSGQTPAERLSLTAYTAYAYVENLGSIFDNIELSPVTCTVDPQRPYTAYADAPAVWTDEHAAQFAAGNFGIYIFGEVRYFDVFGKERFTRFRALFDKDCRPGFTRTCAAGNDTT